MPDDLREAFARRREHLIINRALSMAYQLGFTFNLSRATIKRILNEQGYCQCAMNDRRNKQHLVIFKLHCEFNVVFPDSDPATHALMASVLEYAASLDRIT